MLKTALLILLLGFAPAALAQTVTLRWTAKDGECLGERTLDITALDALPQAEIITTTPWTDGRRRFTGPTLESLARLSGFDPSQVQVTALNEYGITIPSGDWRAIHVVFSTRLDGKPMRVRENGPFWIMYPIDLDPEFMQINYRSRMIWQVKTLDFVVE